MATPPQATESAGKVQLVTLSGLFFPPRGLPGGSKQESAQLMVREACAARFI